MSKPCIERDLDFARAEVAVLRARIEAYRAIIESLEARVQESLEARDRARLEARQWLSARLGGACGQS